MSDIQIWATFTPTELSTDKIKIQIEENALPLPENLQNEIEQAWQKAPAYRQDNQVLFLTKKPEINNEIKINTNQRGFKTAFAFNRDKNFHNRIEELNKYKLITLSTHCLILTSDNKILYGVKTNQSNQVSGFGGFPNAENESIMVEGKKYLDIKQTITNKLTNELGEIAKHIKSIHAVGITYVGIEALRGTDIDCIVRLNIDAKKAKTLFVESTQFSKKLHEVEFEPQKIKEFFLKKEEKTISPYALGCMYLALKTNYPESAQEFLDTVNKVGYTIATQNETNHF